MTTDSKVEVVFIEMTDEDGGFNLLGDFSIWGSVPMVQIPNIGERVIVDLPGKNFAGEVIYKAIEYSQKDIAGKPWSLVTRFIITLELSASAADAALAALPIQ
jgi:hypothetical protein